MQKGIEEGCKEIYREVQREMNLKMNKEELLRTYAGREEKARAEARRLQRQIQHTGSLRLLVFVATAGMAVACRAEGWGVMGSILLAGGVLFVLLMRRHDRLFARKAWQEKLAEVNAQEQAAADYVFTAFDDGKEFIDPAHPYSFDLDLFGPRSLFQSINRTCTEPGRRRLAGWLSRHLEEREEILLRQQAVRQLAPLLDFRQDFRVTGLLYTGSRTDRDELMQWAAAPGVFRRNRFLRLLPGIVTAANVLALLSVILGVIPGSLYALLWAGCLLGSFTFTGRITRMQALYGKKLKILGTYARLLQRIDRLPEELRKEGNLSDRPQETLVGQIGQQVKDVRGESAAEAIARLGRLMDALDQRNNYLMYAVLNGCFFWEVRQMMRIEAWKEKYAEALPRWLEAIAETDALLSLATFAYNHPDYTYATLTGQPFELRGEALGHPLMDARRCVTNDVLLPRRPFFIIVTGANMAGKSTYLRTVGVNYLLACIGAPVCAKWLTLYPARLVTSLRTSDSLTDNESYFFAELKRLKMIIDRLQSGEKLFIILDEILKGANSVDKQKGSLSLIHQLLHLKADGIIATHDLLLGTLADHYPEDIRNCCFEADIRDDALTFSYRMRPGVAQNMNACFLMRKMGITV